MYFSPLNYANEKGIKLSNDVNSELPKAYRKNLANLYWPRALLAVVNGYLKMNLFWKYLGLPKSTSCGRLYVSRRSNECKFD